MAERTTSRYSAARTSPALHSFRGGHWQACYWMKLLAEGYPIKRVIVDPSAVSFRETIRRHGKFAVWNAKNSVLDGIRLTGSLIQTGQLTFHDSCVNTFREFGLYAWDDEHQDEDRVIKESDHAMDMMRYFVMTVMRREIR